MTRLADRRASFDSPGFYYGFVGVGMAWQLAFFVIGSDPVRYRLMMVPAIAEKFLYGVTLIVLYLQGRISPKEIFGWADLVLGLLFVFASWKTRAQRASS
jgi:hypothetical protein